MGSWQSKSLGYVGYMGQPHELGLPFLVFIIIMQYEPTLSIFRRGSDCSGVESC